MTDNALTLRRITKARRAMMRSEDPQFQKFWAGVVQKLQEKIIH